MTRGRTNEAGFSLVEVMVVVVIVAILASITIPIFFKQREKAWQASAESALKNAATALNSASISQGGSYRGISIAELRATEGLKYDLAAIDLVVASANETNYCISAFHEAWQQTIYYDSAEARPGPTDCSSKYR